MLALPRLTTSASFPWYVLRTKSNCERLAAGVLERKGYEQYVPLQKVSRRWSDRTVDTAVPLFRGYVFCRFDAKQRLPVVNTPGVVSVLAFGDEPEPIPDTEIEAIQTVLATGLYSEACPFPREGQRIQMKSGPLEGVEGILLRKKSQTKLIVSLTMLQRSVAVEVDRDWIREL